MNASQDIPKLLGQWLEYTDAETAAIQASAWTSLLEIQKAKSGLQKSITAALDRRSKEGRPDAVFARVDHPFRAEVTRLISLETRNGQLLSVKYAEAQERKKTGERAISNLRKIRRSYGRQNNSGWNSFS